MRQGEVAMLEKNKIYEAEIVDYTSEGQGVAKIEGCAVFVPNAINKQVIQFFRYSIFIFTEFNYKLIFQSKI